MKTIKKPLTKRQREELEGYIAISTHMVRATIFLAFITCVGAILGSLQNLFWNGAPLWLVPTLIVAVWVYRRSERWTGGPKARRRVREDLAAGAVTITIIEPESVQEVEEMEDEGISFIVRDVEGETYMLSGQDMSRYKSKNFPWSKFGVVETPRSRQFFGLERMGIPIPLSSTFPAFEYEQARQLGCFQRSFIKLNPEQRELLDAWGYRAKSSLGD